MRKAWRFGLLHLMRQDLYRQGEKKRKKEDWGWGSGYLCPMGNVIDVVDMT